jgi:hypothetical protein
MDNRRSAGRTPISKAARLLFGRHRGDVEVTDIGEGGAKIYKSGSAILPLTFELSFDNLRRNCRMVWRKGNFFGVTFEDQDFSAEPDLVKAGLGFEEPAFPVTGDMPQLARPDDEEFTEFASLVAERNSDAPSDLRFTVGIALALTLPVVIGVGAYLAATLVLRTG